MAVSRSYIWAYASFQFAIVILFAHIFYTILNVNPILSVVLSTFTGFGIAISTNSLLVECLRWRASRQMGSSNTSTTNELPLQNQQWQYEVQYHRHYHQQRQQRLREESQNQVQQQEQQQRQQHQLNEDPNENGSLQTDMRRET